MDRIRVLVADGHRVFAESLATALTAEQGVEAVAVVSAAAAVRELERGGTGGVLFDVLLIDPGLDEGGGDGAESAGPPDRRQPLLAAVNDRFPEVRAVMLATRDDPRLAARAFDAGAHGWVAKDSSLSRLLQVVRGVLRGETHVPPLLLTGVLRELSRARRHRTEHQRLMESLTPRELEVLRCMLAGLGRKAVAERLYLSPHTVRTHMQNVLSKLGVHSTLAAVAMARRAGVPPME